MPYHIYFERGVYDESTWPPKLIGSKYGIFFEKRLDNPIYPLITYNRLLGSVFPILILGGLLIYTLRDKKQ